MMIFHCLSSAQVINVTTMVVVGMMACQDDEVDAAIATPQVRGYVSRHFFFFRAGIGGVLTVSIISRSMALMLT